MKNLFSPLGKRGRASRANERGRKLRDKGEKAAAIASYQRAMAIDPGWSVPFYNLGLLHKYASEWQSSLEANLRATELDPADQAGWWNLGIAATALGRWDLARQAWRGAGLVVPDGEGPIDLPCGYNPIRLDPEARGSLVLPRPTRSRRRRRDRVVTPAGSGAGTSVQHPARRLLLWRHRAERRRAHRLSPIGW